MNLMPVAEYLADQGIGVIGESIFIHIFPAEVKTGILIRPRLTGAQINHELPGYLKFEFQLIARATNYEASQDLAISAVKALTLNSVTMDTWTVNYMRPSNVPVPYPISIGEIVECNTGIDVCAVVPEWA